MEKRKVLIISSISPYKSANLGLDVMYSLKKGGYEVHFLYPTSRMDIIVIDEAIKTYIPKAPKRSWIKNLRSLFYKKKEELKKEENQFTITHLDESCPPINPELITQKISGTYHFAIILFWQGMITTNSLMHIYNKIKAPLFIMAVDMYPFTGGCFYFWNCRNFIHSECGMCPALNPITENSETKRNYIYKQQVYKNTECVFLGNKWMRSHIKGNPIIGGSPVREIHLVINETIFKIRDKEPIYKEFNLEYQKEQFVILAGAPNIDEKRKGFTYLVESIKRFTKTLSSEEQSKVVLLLVGNTTQDIKRHFNIKIHELGFLDCKKLAKAYNLADVYLSPSIEDAGPSMINQSIMAGTPVVAFNTGVAQDIVITGKTGYCARILDVEDLVKGICSIYSLSEAERHAFQQNCREMGVNNFSYDAYADKIKRLDSEFCASTQ